MLKSGLSDYNDTHTFHRNYNNCKHRYNSNQNNNSKKEVFKDCAPITDYIREINKTQVDNDIDFDEAMPMYNLIQYRDRYSSTRKFIEIL